MSRLRRFLRALWKGLIFVLLQLVRLLRLGVVLLLVLIPVPGVQLIIELVNPYRRNQIVQVDKKR